MELRDKAKLLFAWFNDHYEEMLGKIELIVNMDSFSHDGKDVNVLGETVCSFFEGTDFITEKAAKKECPEDEPWQAELGNVFTARTHKKEDGAGIVFLAHMDTVFPKGTAGRRPFYFDKENDRAYGPGIVEMKSGLIMNIFVARALKELGLVSCPITLTFSPDEEIGSPSALPVLQDELKNALVSFCSEPGYVGNGVTIERKGSGHILLEITGKSSHAGRAYAEGASAILELAHKILAFDKYVDLSRDKTVNTGIIKGGTSANSVAPNAMARIHLTYKTLEEGERLVEAIKEEAAKTYVEGTRTSLSGGLRLPPLVPNAGAKKLYEFVKNAGEMIQYVPFVEASKGAAESGFCSSVLKIPSICSMGPEGGFLHNEKEYIIPSTIIPRCELIALASIQAADYFHK
ncbi:MAG: M20/M25/M40 family metallo-hydrolase [Mailhella sp.]|nr:M20/M25/M40 family metallo-hydrolase [Mailhella sp.]